MTQAIQNETRSVRDMLIAAKVLAKDGKATESPCKTCRVPVWVSFFLMVQEIIKMLMQQL